MTTALRQPDDSPLPVRFARSAAIVDGSWLSTGEFLEWFERAQSGRFRVDRIAFAELDGWAFDGGTGNLVHRSGRFFTVEGLRVNAGFRSWDQPIIVQREAGILGILAREFDGVLHLLMQAKMEPGNANLLQLSPTVQATPSNYLGVHNGGPVPYLDYFTGRRRVRVLADGLQSGHGARFYRKANRNVIVEPVGDVPVEAGFCWLTLGQIGELLRHDNLVNLDTRTILGCVPMPHGRPGAVHTDASLLSWIAAERARNRVRTRVLPLREVGDWVRGEYSVDHVRGGYFRVMAVAVAAANREVPWWTQPLLEPVRRGVAAFVVRRFDGVPHLLAQASVEGGFIDTVEVGPTVQYTPGPYTGGGPLFADLVADARPDQLRYDTVLSEEGGRFFRAETRYLVVETDAAPADPPAGYRWVTPAQLNALVRSGRYVNVQARTLLAVLNSGALTL